MKYPQKITPFLREKLAFLEQRSGTASSEYLGLALQYLIQEDEGEESQEVNLKHYEAHVDVPYVDDALSGIERLYERSLVIETTLVCLAHCRYCLRSNYPKHTMTEKQIIEVAKYCGTEANRDHLSEVLITGGDPLLIPQRLDFLLNALIEYAPNIKIARIATRIPGQDPERIDESIDVIFKNKPSLRFEMATQINHPVEFFPEVESAFRKISSLGVRMYSQNVLLKGVNDDMHVLTDLYNKMRENNIEAHYLFHCIPMKGIHHLRTSLKRGIELARALTSSGKISGRVKPMFAVMTDIGKITLYEGTIIEHKNNRLLLQSHYRLNERLSWNPSWKMPDSTIVDDNGYLRVWYVDGED